MHNLRRVAAGLRGEYLEPERTPEPEEDEAAVFEGLGNGRKAGKDKKGGKKSKSTENDDWQDMAEYEREEGVVEVGDIGTRTTAVQEGEEPEVQATGGAQDGKKKRAAVDSEVVGKVSKEARKKAKKEKNQQRKRDNEKERAKKGE